MISFDIETSPLPLEQLLDQIPEFDPESVKTGNLKDPEKIEAKIQQARQEHINSYLDAAALHAHTGYVLAIGYATDDDKFAIDYSDGGQVGEAAVLQAFWQRIGRWRSERRYPFLGLNIFDFDLPFLIRRCWVNGLAVPEWVLQSDRYFDRSFVDLRRVWLCGQYGAGTKSSFATLAAAFGTSGKVEGVSGKDFASLWNGTQEERRKAIDYLREDCQQPLVWARKMGVVN